MNRAARIALIILGTLLVVALVVAIAGCAVARGPFPDVDGEKTVACLLYTSRCV